MKVYELQISLFLMSCDPLIRWVNRLNAHNESQRLTQNRESNSSDHLITASLKELDFECNSNSIQLGTNLTEKAKNQ